MLPASASRGWLHMLHAMMSVLKVRKAGVTPCNQSRRKGQDKLLLIAAAVPCPPRL